MKKELKALYKKDKKLAIQVAKVLGYKIVSAKQSNLSDYRAKLTSIDSKTAEMVKNMIDLEEAVKKFPAMLKLMRSIDYAVIALKSRINADIGVLEVVPKSFLKTLKK